MATRPNSLEVNRTEGYPTTVIKRTFKTDFTEYLVRIGNQTALVQMPHRDLFQSGERCFLAVRNPMWYEPEDQAKEEERQRRTLV